MSNMYTRHLVPKTCPLLDTTLPRSTRSNIYWKGLEILVYNGISSHDVAWTMNKK